MSPAQHTPVAVLRRRPVSGRLPERPSGRTVTARCLARFVALAALLVTAGPALASPVFDGDAADVWLLTPDGQPLAHGTGQSSHTTQATSGGDRVLVHNAEGDRFPFLVPPATSTVLVNDTANSWPPMGPGTPAVALVGLDGAIFGLADTAATAVLSPPAGTYAAPLRVAVRVLAPPGRVGARTLSVRVDDGPLLRVPGGEHLVTFVTPGDHTIEAVAIEAGREGATVRARYTLTGERGADTDGDGVPDAVEVAFGGDPLNGDTRRLDRDGDGFTDLDEWLRGTDPDAPDSQPADRDADGWPDLDETWRGTDPRDPDSFPAARDLDGAEVVLTLEPTAEVLDLAAANRMWIQAAVGDDDDVAPRAADGGPAAAEFSAMAPPALRLPADAPVVVRAVTGPSPSAPGRSSKAWLAGRPSPAAEARAAVRGDLAPEAWRDAWREAFAARAAPRASLRFDRAQASTVALLERGLALATQQPNALILLADSTSEPRDGALTALDLRYAPFAGGQRGTDAFAAHLRARLRAGALLAMAPALTADAYDRASGPDERAARDRRLAATLRDGPGDAAAARHRVHLLLALGPANADRASARLLDPEGDADNDGLSNTEELRLGTAPDLTDTDGDGQPDGADPCPRDATDACLGGAQAAADTDGDGVPDGVDDCPDVPDPFPEDTDGDGISDACGRAHYAIIRAPAWHPTIRVGQSLTFIAQATGAARGGAVSATWRFDRAAADARGLGPVSVQFDRPGVYAVHLAASVNGLPPLPDQIRVVTVTDRVTSGPSVVLAPEATAVEGEPVALSAAARSDGGPILSWRWNTGDGDLLTGARPTHAWRAEGSYTLTVDVQDARGARARATQRVRVTDAVPHPSLAIQPLAEGGFWFVDRGRSHDRVVTRTWDFGDGARVKDAANSQTHTYARPGRYTVVLTATDADGSTAQVTGTVDAPDDCADLDGDGLCAADDPCPRIHDPDATDLDGDRRGDVCDPPDCATGLHVCQRVAEAGADACEAALDACQASCRGADAACALGCAEALAVCRATVIDHHRRCVGGLGCAGKVRACVRAAARCPDAADAAYSRCAATCFGRADATVCANACRLERKTALLACARRSDPADAAACPATVPCLDACRGARSDCRAEARDAADRCREACADDADCRAACGVTLATAVATCRDADDRCAERCLANPCDARADRDRDGLNDCVDPCPDVPGGDRDHDGVCDTADQCVARPDAAQVDPAGGGQGPACAVARCEVTQVRCAAAVAAQEAHCLDQTLGCPEGCAGPDCATCDPAGVAAIRARCAVADAVVADACAAHALLSCVDAEACLAAAQADAVACQVDAKNDRTHCDAAARGLPDRLRTCEKAGREALATCAQAQALASQRCEAPRGCAEQVLASLATCDAGSTPGACLASCLDGPDAPCPAACAAVRWADRADCAAEAAANLARCPGR